MNNLILIKSLDNSKIFRFLNPISDEDIHKSFIPDNCRIIKENSYKLNQISSLPLISDRIIPLEFKIDEFHENFNPNLSLSEYLIAIPLTIAGKLKRERKNTHLINLISERYSCFMNKVDEHMKLLKEFLYFEKKQNPFIYSNELQEKYFSLQISKKSLIDSTKDIENLLGSKEKEILLDFF